VLDLQEGYYLLLLLLLVHYHHLLLHHLNHLNHPLLEMLFLDLNHHLQM
jgi:hypothetical protein